MEQQIKTQIKQVAQKMQPPYKNPNLPYNGHLSKATTKVKHKAT